MAEVAAEDVYVRLLPREVAQLAADEQGEAPEFKLNLGEALLKLSRVRVAGRVKEVRDWGRMAEAVVGDEGGEVRVRAWGEDAAKLLSLKPGEPVEVLGVLRLFRGEVYVALRLVRRLSEEGLREYVRLLQRDRAVLAGLKEG